MFAERAARLFIIGLALGLPLALAGAKLWDAGRGVEVRGRMPETGGWAPSALTAEAGEPLRLRLTSDDVVHGFAVGHMDWPAVDIEPGKFVDVELVFDRPGTYTFYCTRWCGLNHWRMRGTIEVSGGAPESAPPEPPLFVALGLDIDAPHAADVIPERRPDAGRGAALAAALPPDRLARDYVRAHSPAEVWRALRTEISGELTDAEVWDLVAYVWQSNTSPAALAEGRRLYAANCAACHGETGGGDGVMAPALEHQAHAVLAHMSGVPAFADTRAMLGASPALLHGKIIRGGMGTGMPYWGPIFTDAQSWAVVDYLWTFQFDMEHTQ